MTAEREKLGFVEFVLDQFQFLKDVYSFQCSYKNNYCVCYDSQNVKVCIYHERISYELYLEMGLKHDNVQVHTAMLTDILELAGVHDQRAKFLQASSRESVQAAVDTLAMLTQKYAYDVLSGNEATFRALETLKQERTERLLKMDMLAGIEEKAQNAWRAKDYAKVISLYAPVEGNLNEIQTKRLEYAKSKASE